MVDVLELLGTYPNPAQNQATVRFALPEGAADATLKLYDVLGRSLQTVDLSNVQDRYTRTLDVANIATGMYLLRLTANGRTQTKKLTVVR